MKYNGKEIKIGDVVDIDGEKRVVEKIENDCFYSSPYDGSKAKIETGPAKVEDVINPPESADSEEIVVKRSRRGKK